MFAPMCIEKYLADFEYYHIRTNWCTMLSSRVGRITKMSKLRLVFVLSSRVFHSLLLMDVLLAITIFLGLLCIFYFWMADGSNFLSNSIFSHISPNVRGAPWLLRLSWPFLFWGYFVVFVFCAACEHWYMLITYPVLGASSSAAYSSSFMSLNWHYVLLTTLSVWLHIEPTTHFHFE